MRSLGQVRPEFVIATRIRSFASYSAASGNPNSWTRDRWWSPAGSSSSVVDVVNDALAWFAAQGIPHIERVLTDNGACYRSHAFAAALAATATVHQRTRPYRPQTNGKVERFNRTLLDEWADAPGGGLRRVDHEPNAIRVRHAP